MSLQAHLCKIVLEHKVPGGGVVLKIPVMCVCALVNCKPHKQVGKGMLYPRSRDVLPSIFSM